MEMRSSSVLSIVEPQSVSSRISVLLVEEAEVRGAECLASSPVKKDLRLLAGVACPARVTVCEDCIISPAVVGTLSHLTLTLLALLARMGRYPRLTLIMWAMWALMGRCPHPTLPKYCFRPFLLGCRSQ